MLAAFLRSVGHVVTVANDGDSALAVVASIQPSVAIVDISLGAMDGFTLATLLRAKLGPAFPIFALSAFSSADYRRRAIDHGFQGYFVKPADLAEIESALNAL